MQLKQIVKEKRSLHITLSLSQKESGNICLKIVFACLRNDVCWQKRRRGKDALQFYAV